MRTLLLSTALLLATSCAGTPPEPAPVSLEGWASETIELPPAFAPELPPGVESLRFAPGWSDPESDGYWSYAFAVWLDGPAPDAAGLQAWLDTYYDGLLSAVAASGGRDAGDDPARIEVTETAPGTYRASMRIVDAFGDLEPVALRARVATDEGPETVLRLQVSPQPDDHEIWLALATAVAGIQVP